MPSEDVSDASTQSAWQPPPWTGSPTEDTEPKGAELAGYGWRVLGFLIDGLIIGFVSSLIYRGLSNNALAYFFVGDVIRIAYGAFFLSYWKGQTPGMRIFRLRCVDEENRTSLSQQQPWIRSVSAEVMAALGSLFLPLLLVEAADLLWPVFDAKNQTLHDKIAKTVVVREPSSKLAA